MSMLYILTGLPYAGKTTLRKALVDRYGFDYISIDDIMRTNGHFQPGHPTQDDWNRSYSQAYHKLESFLQEGKTVIWDTASLTRHERDIARQIAKRFGRDTTLIYINTPEEEITARRGRNAVSQERGQLSEKMFADALSMWEPPTEDEHAVLYSTNMNLEEWITTTITSR